MAKQRTVSTRLTSEAGPTVTTSRKAQHVDLAMTQEVAHRSVTTGFERLRFEHNALPELDFAKIDLTVCWLGKQMKAPLLISSMTGGYADATEINRSLAAAANEFGIAMGIGSARQALENETYLRSFSVAREASPTGILISNIGAAEVARLTTQGRIGSLRKLVKLIDADALTIHLNPLQELMQPEGSKNFEGVLRGIAEVVGQLEIPVIIKEVGAGISRDVAARLLHAGVTSIDVAGAGGTSWAGIEILRNEADQREWLEPFWDWGIPTATALVEVHSLRPATNFTLIASGGIGNGVEIAKSIALGADLAAIARPILKALQRGGDQGLRTFVERVLFQLRSVMFLTGSRDVAALKQQRLYPIERPEGETQHSPQISTPLE